MSHFTRISFTPSVKAAQARMGSREAYAKGERGSAGPDAIGDDEASFLAERDSFYMASVGEGGWPYVQHRGGPKGFVRVLDEHTVGFADFRGNRQYISVGNAEHDDRVALIFVDYPHRARLKMLAHASIVTRESDPATLDRLIVPAGAARVERGFVLRVVGLDWNCPQHITPRFTEAEIARVVGPRLAELEEENRRLREQLARSA